MKKATFQPSEAELEILNAIWQMQPVSVREIHERLAKSVGYTTVLKQIQRLTEKGVLEKTGDNAAAGAHRYRCLLDETEVKRALAGKMLHAAFGGSALKMMLHALGNDDAKTSREELESLKNWLDQQTRQQK